MVTLEEMQGHQSSDGMPFIFLINIIDSRNHDKQEKKKLKTRRSPEVKENNDL